MQLVSSLLGDDLRGDLEQCFSAFSAHENHTEGLLNSHAQSLPESDSVGTRRELHF